MKKMRLVPFATTSLTALGLVLVASCSSDPAPGPTGTGGSTPGTGGSTATGGTALPGTGGSPPGTGGAVTGSGGAASGGAASGAASGGAAGAKGGSVGTTGGSAAGGTAGAAGGSASGGAAGAGKGGTSGAAGSGMAGAGGSGTGGSTAGGGAGGGGGAAGGPAYAACPSGQTSKGVACTFTDTCSNACGLGDAGTRTCTCAGTPTCMACSGAQNTYPAPASRPPVCEGTEAAMEAMTTCPTPKAYCLPSDNEKRVCVCVEGKGVWNCDSPPWPIPA